MKIRYDKAILIGALAGRLLLTGLVACSSPEPAAETNNQDIDLSELEELYWSRLESARMSFTQADVDFMNDMIVHHAQALIMSRLAPENNASPGVQTLAARIINAQNDEIATMQQWLRDRGQPVPVIHIDGLMLMVHMEGGENEMDHGGMDHEETDHHHQGNHETVHHDMTHHHDMPGMLTQEQLEKLANLSGPDFDRTFLEFMIVHHEGAVIMVRELFEADGAANDPETFDLSSDIYAEQVTEINRMKLMLENMFNN